MGAHGGAGADALLMTDASSQIVSGSSLGNELTLDQIATGGAAGNSNGGNAGRAGNAVSSSPSSKPAKRNCAERREPSEGMAEAARTVVQAQRAEVQWPA